MHISDDDFTIQGHIDASILPVVGCTNPLS
jgi:hypothetical protein